MQSVRYSLAVSYRNYASGCNYGALVGEEIVTPVGVAWQKGIVPINSESIITLFYDRNGREKEQAVATAAEALFQIRKQENKDAKSICRSVNGAVYDFYKQNGINGSLTAAGVRFFPNRVAVCNLGDISVFRYRMGRLDCFSADHRVKVGRIGVNSIVTQFFGQAEDKAIAPSFSSLNIQQGDIFLLCSASVTDTVEKKRILTIVEENGIDDIGTCLVNEAVRKGQAKDAAVVVCRAQ